RRRKETCQHSHGCGFAGPVRSQKAHNLPLLYLEGDVVDSCVARVPLRKLFNGDHVFLFLAARCTTFRTAPRRLNSLPVKPHVMNSHGSLSTLPSKKKKNTSASLSRRAVYSNCLRNSANFLFKSATSCRKPATSL